MQIRRDAKAGVFNNKLRIQPLCRSILSVFLLMACFSFAEMAKGKNVPNPIRLGVVESFFRDVPEPMVGVAMKPFSTLVKMQTGLDSELAPPTDTETVAEQLSKNKIQLALFEGVEFAWAKKNHPDLHPLVIVVNEHRNRQAFLIVRQDSKITRFSDLQGKQLAIPRRSRSHCYLFVERLSRENGKEAKDFFSKLISSSGAEAALDDLADGGTQAVVVDREALDCYKRRKPGRFGKLKELLKSEVFPDSVIAYRSGVFDQAVLNRFREGLGKAGSTPIGRQLLILWQMTSFEDVPADYEKMLAEIGKAYPRPKASGSKRD